MARRNTTQALDLWMNGDRVGRWSISGNGTHHLVYEASWMSSAAARPLSLSLPLQDPGVPHQGAVVEDYFENLLPDNRTIRERIQRRFGLRSTRAFDLLAEIGRDCAGAVQIVPMDMAPPDVRQIESSVLNVHDIARILRGIPAANTPGSRGTEPFRISLAGAQEKTALLRHRGRWRLPAGTTPTTHIFKLPIGTTGVGGIDLSQSVENEWICSRIVRAYGLPIAECSMERFEDVSTLVVTRFDRRVADDGTWILRLPQEDLCQAFGVAPSAKYESEGGPGVERVMNLLLGSSRADEDRLTFFRAALVFWLLAAIDGHAKNFSIHLDAGGRYRLTPLYDVLSAHPFVGKGRGRIAVQELRMAMAVMGQHRQYHWQRILPRHWRETARRCGLGSRIDSLLDELIRQTPRVLDEVAHNLPDDFPQHISDPILNGVRDAARSMERNA